MMLDFFFAGNKVVRIEYANQHSSNAANIFRKYDRLRDTKGLANVVSVDSDSESESESD